MILSSFYYEVFQNVVKNMVTALAFYDEQKGAVISNKINLATYTSNKK